MAAEAGQGSGAPSEQQEECQVQIPLRPGPVPARLIQRVNRFLLDCRLESNEARVSAHLPNSGRLGEILRPGARLWLRPSPPGGRRKTAWTAVLAEVGAGGPKREVTYVSLDTTLPNDLAAAALEQGNLPEFQGWRLVRREFSIDGKRFDFLLENGQGERLVLEVKSVSKVVDGFGLFPDAVTERGRRHLALLLDLHRRRGWRGAVLFVVQRLDARVVTADEEADPAFTAVFRQILAAGVPCLARRCRVTPERVELCEPLPVVPARGGA